MENQEQNHPGDLEQTELGHGSSGSGQQGSYNSRKAEDDGHQQQRDSLPTGSEDLPESEADNENEENNKDGDDFGVRTNETA